MHDTLVTAAMSGKEVTKHQVKSWLDCRKKVSSASLLESALGSAQEWKARRTMVSATGDHEVIVAGEDVARKRTRLVAVTKAMLRVVLKLKLRLILACDSIHKVIRNY